MVRANAVQGVSEGALGQQLVAGRNGIQTIFTFLDCQLPLPYTHLVCLLVKVWFFRLSLTVALPLGQGVVTLLHRLLLCALVKARQCTSGTSVTLATIRA
jgi:hypothetical protein